MRRRWNVAAADLQMAETMAAYREIRAPFRMQLIEKTQGGLASARNRGAEAASGKILHFLDDDVMPSQTQDTFLAQFSQTQGSSFMSQEEEEGEDE